MPYDILMPERKHIPIVCLVIPDSFSTRAGLVGDIIGERRGVAQSGRAPAWGVGGRRFESDHPDQKNKAVNEPIRASVNSFYVSRNPLKLADVLSSFIYSSAHKSSKTIKTLYETLTSNVIEANGLPVFLSLKALKELNDTQGTKAGGFAPFIPPPL